jgi:hypothetical protein
MQISSVTLPFTNLGGCHGTDSQPSDSGSSVINKEEYLLAYKHTGLLSFGHCLG